MHFNNGKVLLELKRQKMTQTELADKLGMTRAGVSFALVDPNVVKKIATVDRYARALGVPSKDLLIE